MYHHWWQATAAAQYAQFTYTYLQAHNLITKIVEHSVCRMNETHQNKETSFL